MLSEWCRAYANRTGIAWAEHEVKYRTSEFLHPTHVARKALHHFANRAPMPGTPQRAEFNRIVYKAAWNKAARLLRNS